MIGRARAPWRAMGWAAAGAVLLLALAGTWLTEAVDWAPGDFAAAALLLGGAGLALEGVARLPLGGRGRALLAAAVLGGLLLAWAELAVGLAS